ncbi:hypothetical protein [Microseira sp. BLCC-F43]|jgi:hypothetical protein|uniref:hypothetical protein n=1 Tax=Microseira sp. BLCC-F43 TaxID=3153602 RepID=UPI0035B7B0CB
MTIKKCIKSVKYVANANGKKTDVIIPIEVWESLLASWENMVEALENREDAAIFQEWLHQKKNGELETISLDDLEKELISDGLISS